MATLTRGEFEEFHDQKDIVEIGSVLYNTRTEEVAGFLDEGQTTLDVSSATIATSIDPLCEKYYWISPYAYVANNPIRYIDPDGRKIFGTDGKPVTYSFRDGLSSNASQGVALYAQYIAQTQVGRELLGEALNASYTIKVNMVTNAPEGETRLGVHLGEYNSTTGAYQGGTINLFLDNIENSTDRIQKAKSEMGKGIKYTGVSEQIKAVMDSETTYEQRIGQVAVHETSHSVDPNGRGRIVGTAKAEQTATKYENRAIKETAIQNQKIKNEVRLLDVKK